MSARVIDLTRDDNGSTTRSSLGRATLVEDLTRTPYRRDNIVSPKGRDTMAVKVSQLADTDTLDAPEYDDIEDLRARMVLGMQRISSGNEQRRSVPRQKPFTSRPGSASLEHESQRPTTYRRPVAPVPDKHNQRLPGSTHEFGSVASKPRDPAIWGPLEVPVPLTAAPSTRSVAKTDPNSDPHPVKAHTPTHTSSTDKPRLLQPLKRAVYLEAPVEARSPSANSTSQQAPVRQNAAAAARHSEAQRRVTESLKHDDSCSDVHAIQPQHSEAEHFARRLSSSSGVKEQHTQAPAPQPPSQSTSAPSKSKREALAAANELDQSPKRRRLDIHGTGITTTNGRKYPNFKYTEDLPRPPGVGMLVHTNSRRGALVNTTSRRGVPYTPADDLLLYQLKQQGLRWSKIAAHFPGRTTETLQVRYSTKIKKNPPVPSAQPAHIQGVQNTRTDDPAEGAPADVIGAKRAESGDGAGRHEGILVTVEQEADPQERKTEKTGRWTWRRRSQIPLEHIQKEESEDTDSVPDHVPTRQSRTARLRPTRTRSIELQVDGSASDKRQHEHFKVRTVRGRLRRRATGGAPMLRNEDSYDDDSAVDALAGINAAEAWIEPNKDAQLLHLSRHRELGLATAPGMNLQHDRLRTQNLCYESLTATGYMDDTSGDIATIAWAPNDLFFAGGGVVLMDESSMQYNRPRNLLLGDTSGTVRELPEHHIQRPHVEAGVNSLAAMRQTQDRRLFTTVQSVKFSPDSRFLYSVSTDGKLNSYNTDCARADQVTFESTYTHGGAVDLLTVGRHGLIATGCRSLKADSISVFKHEAGGPKLQMTLSSRSASTSEVSYASALKWGKAPHQSNWLLAGFGQEKQRLYREDSDLDILGEACLFDGETGQRLDFGLPRNVFDVAWNPILGNTAFAVASVGFGKVNKGVHTVIRLMRDGQGSLRCSVELECQARDINDIVYCPYDEHMIAAGSTDGKVYIWDVRATRINQDPLTTMSHGNCISVLPHDRKRWEVDTGVRFLSWGATHTSLFSASSDGIVKAWNPYLHHENAHTHDVATFSSAIMAGAFNSDHTSLLIGEDQSRLTRLDVGAPVAPARRFPLISAPEPGSDDPPPHHALLEKGEIVFEHAGPLPVRQALQGPNYIPAQTLVSPEDAELYTAAFRHQRELFHQRNRWKKLRRRVQAELGPVPSCKLDCGYLPRNDGDGAEVPDSRRAEDRVPDALRREGLTGLQAQLKGLVATYTCGRAARPKDDGEVKCERCAFACFRCGRDAQLDLEQDKVRCETCAVEWSIGVLGYEITNHGMMRKERKKHRHTKSDGKADFGEELLAQLLDQTL